MIMDKNFQLKDVYPRLSYCKNISESNPAACTNPCGLVD